MNQPRHPLFDILAGVGWPLAWQNLSYLTAWARYLARDDVQLVTSYDAEGPTLDLIVDGTPAIRWLLAGDR